MGDHQGDEAIRAGVGDGDLNLPPGFRFHPSDEEIITFYLRPKVLDGNFTTIAIGETDINNSEPWELPMKAKMGEDEWYFYCLRDHKYQTGRRVNRATNAGFWKATGKDKEIYQTSTMMPTIVGMKKTLVFYTGRAPKGEKTEWIMHEYRLEGSYATTSSNPTMSKEWVICRVFHKSARNKDVSLTPSEEATTNNVIDQGSMSFPTSVQFSMEPKDFSIELSAMCPLVDLTMPFYSTIDASSSMEPTVSPMATMGTMDINGI